MSSIPPDTAVEPAPVVPGGPRPRNVRRMVLIIGLVVLLAVVGTAAAAETYFRKRNADCIATQVQRDLGSKVSVHFGPKPLLLTAIDHNVQYVTVDSDDAKFGPAVGMKVHARLNDITLTNGGSGGATVGSSTADAAWSDDGIAQTLSGLVTGVQSSPGDGTLDVKVLGGLADLKLQPRVVGNQIQVGTASAQLLGLGIPTDLVDGIVQLMTQSLQSYPMNLQPTAVQVTDNGITVHLTGGATQLQGGSGGTC
ncbi:LmeA family phospholipid-binding protein [Nocardia terpenica]|uniref:LmeA family phospholipid-binding protein n=1 Tax=Nocardia terpenica TaxID=455432 RepID=UPI001E4472C3|nr:DUF2993 domain-containing protein [Nocardia terpenica]